jgi:hypothetical protein
MTNKNNVRDPGRYEKGARTDTGTELKPQVAQNAPTSNGEDILAMQDLDPALDAKMHLVNNVGSRY